MWVRAKAMATGTALGLMLVASSAGAQDAEGSAALGSYGGPPEQVIVTPPPHVIRRSFIGAPIIDVSLSKAVRTDDLDLRTGDGARVLRSRVLFTATTLCRRINALYPVTYDGASDQWPRDHNCYRNAVNNGLAQADGAIRAARGVYAGY